MSGKFLRHIWVHWRAQQGFGKVRSNWCMSDCEVYAFSRHRGRRLPSENYLFQCLEHKTASVGEFRKRLKSQLHDIELVDFDTELLDLLSRQIKALDDAVQTQIKTDPQMKNMQKYCVQFQEWIQCYAPFWLVKGPSCAQLATIKSPRSLAWHQ